MPWTSGGPEVGVVGPEFEEGEEGEMEAVEEPALAEKSCRESKKKGLGFGV